MPRCETSYDVVKLLWKELKAPPFDRCVLTEKQMVI